MSDVNTPADDGVVSVPPGDATPAGIPDAAGTPAATGPAYAAAPDSFPPRDVPVVGVLGGYPPLGEAAAPPVEPKKSRLWLWLTIGAAALLVIAGTTTVVAITALTPRNESLAQKTCLDDTADQMKNPASTKFSKVMVGQGWDKKASKPVVMQWVQHASADDADAITTTVADFENDAGNGLKKNTYVVTAAVDGTNSYGAVVRQYVLCYVGVVDTKVTQKPSEVFTSSN